ncbi:uncharacterized protein LOC117600542 [Osmia lignaria lignaria]|uniref:uncharacterized protein LOC117600542 n=1 Tax=Osmia lignaria lignaria TaxID=1437193 RepID=UPI00402B5912
MSRPLLNLSKSGLNVNESRKLSSKTLKFKKSITVTSRKCSSNLKNQDRLLGGADAPVETEDINTTKEISEDTSIEVETIDQTSTSNIENGKISFPSNGPCCSCLSQVPGSTGDKKVDEMIDDVHQNLQEAGKALATLSENFEHESKLMFVDILGRIQQWTNIVQAKLDLCKAVIEALRKELMARACEIANLRKLLAECEEREKQAVSTQTSTPPPQEEQHKTVVDNIDDIEPDEPIEDKTDNDEEKADKEESQQGRDTLEIVCTDAAIQSILKDKDRMRREMELEAEISRLRKENERIIKERAEYENAIQRALLRGVSSLNVEALRVLRCPPIPCCSPCAPCPTATMKSTMGKKGCVTQKRIENGKGCIREADSYTIKRPCGSPCCSGGKNQKSVSNNSMIFLLHQNDAENICGSKTIKMPQVCGSPLMKKIEIPPCPRYTK